MVKLNLKQGFSLLETLLAFVLIQIFIWPTLALNQTLIAKIKAQTSLLQITQIQYRAYQTHQSACVMAKLFSNGQPCFNAAGNARQAQTYVLLNISGYRIVVNLGAGKHYVK